MHGLQAKPITHLPLSWTRTNVPSPMLDGVALPFTAVNWIPTAEIPVNLTFDALYHEYLKLMSEGFVLQSVSLALRDYLLGKGGQAAPMGAEAVLDLPWRGKKSVRELARRGRRHGAVREVARNQETQTKLSRLVNESPSRQGVQLRHTERPFSDPHTRIFVFETPEQNWFGAVTLSTTDSDYLHTELLIRHRSAPTGVMEALVVGIAQQLAEEGVKHLSLGNVSPLPEEAFESIFAPHRHPNELWRRSERTFKLGRSLNFAYNADGLWRFKNKFSPRWEPLYVYASKRLSWQTVLGIAQATGYLNLVKNGLSDLWSEKLAAVQQTFQPSEIRQMFTKLSYVSY